MIVDGAVADGGERTTRNDAADPPLRLQVVSDTHLEHAGARAPEVPVLAPYLALLGDVGDPFSVRYAAFLRDQARRFRRVFVVAGNHEYYHNGRKDVLAEMRRVAPPNVHVLEKEWVDVEEGHRVCGTTLWSDLDPRNAWELSDFQCIHGWTWDRAVGQHRACVEFVENQIADATEAGRPLVVLTHHAPLEGVSSHPKYATSTCESAYSTDLTRLMRPPVRAWFHGHTHWSYSTTVGGVLVGSNAVGLLGEPTGFDATRVFEVA